jgi:hypothetical protein
MAALFSSLPSTILLVCILLDSTVAFVMPKSFIPSIQAPETVKLSALGASPFNHDLLSTSALSSSSPSFTFLADGIGGTITTIASVIAIIVFVFGALLLIMANIVIPQAAQELERKAREEYPHYWAACEAKLEEGEILAMRPDLIQELGRQVQEADLKKFEEVQSTGAPDTTVIQEETQSSSSSSSGDDVVDVEVITETKKNE